MDFIEQITALSTQISEQVGYIKTEEATKNAIIMPFINTLGYNVFNPLEVVPEFTTDVGTKKGEKVDYAIMKKGNPIMLFECKSVKVDLDEDFPSQLYRYFSVTPVKVGVLTNGIKYKFYSDLEEKNKMDEKPFLEFNILDIKENAVKALKRFRKEVFNVSEITFAASDLKYTKEIKRVLEEQLNSPSDEFVKFFTNKVYSGMKTKNVLTKFTDITQRSFQQFIIDKINDRLQSALEQGVKSEELEETKPSKPIIIEGNIQGDGIHTSEMEVNGCYIVRAILQEVVEPERVFLKDYKSYSNILLDNKRNKPICRFYFDGKNKYIGLIDEDKNDEKIPIEKLSEIYKYKDKIKTTLGYYLKSSKKKLEEDL